MTGFGSASIEAERTHYHLEIRTLNSKYLKAHVRMPDDLQGLEAEVESSLAKHISRGSAVVTLRVSDASANAAAQLNLESLKRYVEQLRSVADDDRAHIDLGALINLPGVIIEERTDALIEQARPVVLELLEQACANVVTMRNREGETLHRELHRHREVVATHLAVVEAHVPQLIDLYQQKLRQRMESLLADSGAAVRDEDILREVAVFAERSDIAEEVARLHGHLHQFAELIDSDGSEPIGRTLDFLAQEMLREANTIGSKCLDVEVARRIVEIKGAIDRIKEQVQNVE